MEYQSNKVLKILFSFINALIFMLNYKTNEEIYLH